MTKWIRSNTSNTNKSCYHTDPDCEHLDEKRPVSEIEIEYHNLRECAFCDSDKDPRPNEEVDRSHYRALQEAAENE
jgi:hypothetical protein